MTTEERTPHNPWFYRQRSPAIASVHTGWHTDMIYGYGIRIRQLGKVFTCTRLHSHGYINTACPQFHSLSQLTRTCSMAPISSKLYNYMLQQDDILVKILYLYRQIKKKKAANNMISMRRWWIHPILLKREEQGTYHRLMEELQLDAERYQSCPTWIEMCSPITWICHCFWISLYGLVYGYGKNRYTKR